MWKWIKKLTPEKPEPLAAGQIWEYVVNEDIPFEDCHEVYRQEILEIRGDWMKMNHGQVLKSGVFMRDEYTIRNSGFFDFGAGCNYRRIK